MSTKEPENTTVLLIIFIIFMFINIWAIIALILNIHR